MFSSAKRWGMFQQCQHTQDKGGGGRCEDYKLSPKAWKHFKILKVKDVKISYAFSNGQLYVHRTWDNFHNSCGDYKLTPKVWQHFSS